MAENPLKIFETLDPELLEAVENGRKMAFGEGVLPRKYKYLIALALDAFSGATDGVTSLARAAMNAGANREEIAETLRVTQFISGSGSIYASGRGLSALF